MDRLRKIDWGTIASRITTLYLSYNNSVRKALFSNSIKKMYLHQPKFWSLAVQSLYLETYKVKKRYWKNTKKKEIKDREVKKKKAASLFVSFIASDNSGRQILFHLIVKMMEQLDRSFLHPFLKISIMQQQNLFILSIQLHQITAIWKVSSFPQ